MELGDFYNKSSEWQQNMWVLLMEQLYSTNMDLASFERILDIGCGTGNRTQKLSNVMQNVKEIIAIDSSGKMIQTALQNIKDNRIIFFQLAAKDLNIFTNYQFDVIHSNWALHWIDDKEKLLHNLNKISKQGSIFIFSTCQSLPDFFTDIDNYIKSHLGQKTSNIFHYLTIRGWTELLMKYNWKPIKTTSMTLTHIQKSSPKFFNHWIAASDGKVFYDLNIEKFMEKETKNMLACLNDKYLGEDNNWVFKEDVLFIIAQKTK